VAFSRSAEAPGSLLAELPLGALRAMGHVRLWQGPGNALETPLTCRSAPPHKVSN
jgi:hypothetical protein